MSDPHEDDNNNDDPVDECESCGTILDPDNGDDMFTKMCSDCIEDANTNLADNEPPLENDHRLD